MLAQSVFAREYQIFVFMYITRMTERGRSSTIQFIIRLHSVTALSCRVYFNQEFRTCITHWYAPGQMVRRVLRSVSTCQLDVNDFRRECDVYLQPNRNYVACNVRVHTHKIRRDVTPEYLWVASFGIKILAQIWENVCARRRKSRKKNE